MADQNYFERMKKVQLESKREETPLRLCEISR